MSGFQAPRLPLFCTGDLVVKQVTWPWLGELKCCLVGCDEALRVGYQQELVDTLLAWDAGIQSTVYNAVVNDGINQTSGYTAAPDRCTILCSRIHKSKCCSAQG